MATLGRSLHKCELGLEHALWYHLKWIAPAFADMPVALSGLLGHRHARLYGIASASRWIAGGPRIDAATGRLHQCRRFDY